MSRTRRRKGSQNNTGISVRPVVPRSPAQSKLIEIWKTDRNVLLTGMTGTGKTHVSIALALRDVLAEKYERLIVVRSLVPGRPVGFMPGTLAEKERPFLEFYRGILADVCGRHDAADVLGRHGMFVTESTSCLRGTTWNSSVVLFDEAQNCTEQEFSTVVTRIGEGSRIVVVGDGGQNDLTFSKSDTSGFDESVRILSRMPSVSRVDFGIEDVVRSGFVREWLESKHDIR